MRGACMLEWTFLRRLMLCGARSPTMTGWALSSQVLHSRGHAPRVRQQQQWTNLHRGNMKDKDDQFHVCAM